MKGNPEQQSRFLDLHFERVLPIKTKRKGAAAAFPADHAYNLYKELEHQDLKWRQIAKKRAIRWGSGMGLGAVVKWAIENWDNIGGIFGIGLSIAIGFLVVDDVYDGGNIGSFAILGLLFAVLIELPESDSGSKRPKEHR